MVKHVGGSERLNSDSGSKLNLILAMVFGNVLLALGAIALLAPEVLLNFFSDGDVQQLSSFAFPLILVGMALEGFALFQFIKTKTHETKKQQHLRDYQSTNMEPASEKSLRNTLVTDEVTQSAYTAERESPKNFTSINVDWSPMKSGGANFKTHALKNNGVNQMMFVASTGMFLFALFFSLIGGIVGIVFLVSSGEIIPTIIGFVFVAVGLGMYFFAAIPRVFDKEQGFYWKGKLKRINEQSIMNCKEYCRLREVEAIQIVSEYVKSDKSRYYSYEINLVLRNGKRIHVIDHGNKKSIEKDAEQLSQFLKVPVIKERS